MAIYHRNENTYEAWEDRVFECDRDSDWESLLSSAANNAATEDLCDLLQVLCSSGVGPLCLLTTILTRLGADKNTDLRRLISDALFLAIKTPTWIGKCHRSDFVKVLTRYCRRIAKNSRMMMDDDGFTPIDLLAQRLVMSEESIRYARRRPCDLERLKEESAALWESAAHVLGYPTVLHAILTNGDNDDDDADHSSSSNLPVVLPESLRHMAWKHAQAATHIADVDGNYPLHLAAMSTPIILSSSPSAVRLLLDIDPSVAGIPNAAGQYPAMLAAAASSAHLCDDDDGTTDVVALLVAYPPCLALLRLPNCSNTLERLGNCDRSKTLVYVFLKSCILGTGMQFGVCCH